MEQDNIIKKIEEIYVSKNKEGKPVGRNFITHLLRSYFPAGKAHKVIDIQEKPMKCAITGQKLFAAGEILVAMQDEKFDFKAMLRYNLDPQENNEHPFEKITKGRIIGLVGENTDAYLCYEAYQGLYNWYANKILHGDKHVSWVVKDMRIKETIKSVREKLPDTEDQKKIDRLEKLAQHPKRATTSLGDMSILKELQEKLKFNEEKEK